MSKVDVLRVPDYLGHILEAIERIHLYIGARVGRMSVALSDIKITRDGCRITR